MFYDAYIKICSEFGVAPTRVLADLGISKSAYTGWKNGGDPSNRTAKQIADYFGITVAELMSGEVDTKKGPADNDEANAMMREIYERPELKALFKTAKRVRPEDIQMADEMLKRFAEGYRDD